MLFMASPRFPLCLFINNFPLNYSTNTINKILIINNNYYLKCKRFLLRMLQNTFKRRRLRIITYPSNGIIHLCFQFVTTKYFFSLKQGRQREPEILVLKPIKALPFPISCRILEVLRVTTLAPE